jgi:hypothetical protein
MPAFLAMSSNRIGCDMLPWASTAVPGTAEKTSMINARRIIVTLQLLYFDTLKIKKGATAAILRAAVTPLKYNRRRGLSS